MKISTIVCLALLAVLAVGSHVQTVCAEDKDWQQVVQAAKKEGVVNAYTVLLSAKAYKEVSKEIKNKYGITIEAITGRSTSKLEKIKMEQTSKAYFADTFDTGSAYTGLLKNDGFLQKLAVGLPALKEKDKFFQSPIEDPPESQLLTVALQHMGLWVNTNLVKPENEPKSYSELLDPKWKNKIFLNNPIYAGTPDTMLVIGENAKFLDVDYFKKLYKDAKVAATRGAQECFDKLSRGECAIAGFAPGDMGMRYVNDGAPIKPLDMKEGNVFRKFRFVAINNLPHPNATKVLMNWLLSKEGQLVLTKVTSMDGIRNDIPSAMPFTFKGRKIYQTYEELMLGAERYSTKYLANKLGIKK